MACIATDPIKAHISGFSTDAKEGIIWYRVQIETRDDVYWTVERRYSDFESLHKKLVDTQGVNVILPPKKLIGNLDPGFVEKRREKLNSYLKQVIQLLGKNPPPELAVFLNLYDYEILFVLRKMALDIFERGEEFIINGAAFPISPYQIYAIKERMKMALPPLDSTDKREDFSHLIDFCTNVKRVDVIGSNIALPKSTIIPNHFSMDLSPFKALTELTLKLVNMTRLSEVSSVRPTIRRLSVHNSHLESTSQVLLCDTLYKTYEEAGPAHVWRHLHSLHLSNNVLQSVSDLGMLTPNLRALDVSFNQLINVFDLTSLPYLEHVSYAGNLLHHTQNLHLAFGNIRLLDISRNQLETLEPFSKLYSLVFLNLSCNRVADVQEVSHLAKLRVLECLMLTGNPVASSLDYRVRALAFFGTRATDLALDNEKASLSEVDQISILQAIQKAREFKQTNNTSY